MRSIFVAAALCVLVCIRPGYADTALASFYHEGTRTANGERFRPDGLTAAHRELPFGTLMQVCRESRCVRVRINDRGPAAWTGRDLDLSRGAARALGFLRAGIAQVTYSVLGVRAESHRVTRR